MYSNAMHEAQPSAARGGSSVACRSLCRAAASAPGSDTSTKMVNTSLLRQRSRSALSKVVLCVNPSTIVCADEAAHRVEGVTPTGHPVRSCCFGWLFHLPMPFLAARAQCQNRFVISAHGASGHFARCWFESGNAWAPRSCCILSVAAEQPGGREAAAPQALAGGIPRPESAWPAGRARPRCTGAVLGPAHDTRL